GMARSRAPAAARSFLTRRARIAAVYQEVLEPSWRQLGVANRGKAKRARSPMRLISRLTASGVNGPPRSGARAQIQHPHPISETRGANDTLGQRVHRPPMRSGYSRAMPRTPAPLPTAGV